MEITTKICNPAFVMQGPSTSNGALPNGCFSFVIVPKMGPSYWPPQGPIAINMGPPTAIMTGNPYEITAYY